MKKPVKHRFITSIFAFFCLLIVSGNVQSQCVVINTSVGTAGGSYNLVTKTLSAPALCQTTAMNAAGCVGSASAMFTNMLDASAFSTSTGVFCNWSCTCGTPATAPHVITDGSDGLPVELMEYGVE